MVGDLSNVLCSPLSPQKHYGDNNRCGAVYLSAAEQPSVPKCPSLLINTSALIDVGALEHFG